MDGNLDFFFRRYMELRDVVGDTMKNAAIGSITTAAIGVAILTIAVDKSIPFSSFFLLFGIFLLTINMLLVLDFSFRDVFKRIEDLSEYKLKYIDNLIPIGQNEDEGKSDPAFIMDKTWIIVCRLLLWIGCILIGIAFIVPVLSRDIRAFENASLHQIIEANLSQL